MFHTHVRDLQNEREEQIERRARVAALRNVSRRGDRRARWWRSPPAPSWPSPRRRQTGLVGDHHELGPVTGA
jgi:hypothetical protein